MSIAALNVRGPFRGRTGYEHHTRELVRELHAHGIAIHLEHNEFWQAPAERAGFLDPLYESLNRPVEARLCLQFCMPHQVVRDAGRIAVNFTMFESNRIPAYWAALSKRVEWTIVPNAFCRDAWVDSGVPPERVLVSPLGVRSELFAGAHEPMPIQLDSGRPFAAFKTRFLNVSAWNNRKNTVGLIGAWLRATSSTDDAALVIKLDCDETSRVAIFTSLLTDAQRLANRRLADAAPVHLYRAALLDEEMPRLYAGATHYISLSHGEGWDLPMMEATASGLIPIAPDHSAYRAYLSDDVAFMIPSRLVRVPPQPQIDWLQGLHWWDPDESAAIAIIRAILDTGAMPSASARDRILGDFSWRRAGDRLVEILDALDSISPG